MRAAQGWPLALAGVLGVTVVANVFLLYAANDHNAAVVEPDYYRKAVAWDSSAAGRDASDALSWRLEAALEPLGGDGAGILRVRVTDRGGAPVAFARIACTAIHNLDAAARPHAEGVLDAEGAAALRLPLARAGLWELRFEANRGAERFAVTLRRDATLAARPAGG
jgi:nitrogen fixation protein FixH